MKNIEYTIWRRWDSNRDFLLCLWSCPFIKTVSFAFVYLKRSVTKVYNIKKKLLSVLRIQPPFLDHGWNEWFIGTLAIFEIRHTAANHVYLYEFNSKRTSNVLHICSISISKITGTFKKSESFVLKICKYLMEGSVD